MRGVLEKNRAFVFCLGGKITGYITKMLLRWFYAMSFLLLLLLCATNGVLVRSRNERETCELKSKHLHVRANYNDPDGGRTVQCRGRVTTNYCEGSCRSKTLPTVRASTGFAKLCRCCFERTTETVDVWLDHCEASGGTRLPGRYFQMLEPTSCGCQRCS